MWNSAHVMDMVNDAEHFGVDTSTGKFDWAYMKEARDSYVTRLNGIYERNLANSGVRVVQGVSERIVDRVDFVYDQIAYPKSVR